jgi:hypothetical protein
MTRRQLLLVHSQLRQRVDAQEQGPGLLVGDVQDLHLHFHVRVQLATQVAVDQLEPAVGQFVGQQAAGEADLLVQGLQGADLVALVVAVVELVRHQVAGTDTTVGLDAVADLHDGLQVRRKRP